MRHLKSALVGLVCGVLLAAAALIVEIANAQRTIAAQVATCADYVCDSAAQVGDLKLLAAAFVLGFAVAFAWFLRRRRHASSA